MIDRNHELNRAMWASCLLWAVNEPRAVEQFRAETGCNYQPPKNGIEKMIDDATGSKDEFARRFIVWFNENVWGAELAPDWEPSK